MIDRTLAGTVENSKMDRITLKVKQLDLGRYAKLVNLVLGIVEGVDVLEFDCC